MVADHIKRDLIRKAADDAQETITRTALLAFDPATAAEIIFEATTRLFTSLMGSRIATGSLDEAELYKKLGEMGPHIIAMSERIKAAIASGNVDMSKIIEKVDRAFK